MEEGRRMDAGGMGRGVLDVAGANVRHKTIGQQLCGVHRCMHEPKAILAVQTVGLGRRRRAYTAHSRLIEPTGG